MRRIELVGKKGFLTKAQETRRLTRLPVNLQGSPRGNPCLQWIQYSNTRFARNLALSRIWWQIFMAEEIPPAEFSKIHVQRRSHFASGCRSWGKSLSPGSLVIIDCLLSLHGASLLSCFVVQLLSCDWLCNPKDCSTPGFSVLHYLLEFAQTHVHWAEMPSNHLILCRPLLLLSSIFPSIRVISNESALHIRCLKYWTFNFTS